MNMTGERAIPAARQIVWAALNNPNVLRQCIPGCQSLEKTSDTEMTAKVKISVGPVHETFSGRVTLSDLDPPNGYRLTGEGSGGLAGHARGGATVHLSDESSGTLLSYQAEAEVGGKLAQLGSRLIDSVAKKLADEFFTRFADVVAAPPQSATLVTPATTTRVAPAIRAAGESRGHLMWAWITGAVAVIGLLLYLGTR